MTRLAIRGARARGGRAELTCRERRRLWDYFASHQSSAFVSGLRGCRTKFRTLSLRAAGGGDLVERDDRYVPRHLCVRSVEDAGLLLFIKDPAGLIEIPGHQPLAVNRSS